MSTLIKLCRFLGDSTSEIHNRELPKRSGSIKQFVSAEFFIHHSRIYAYENNSLREASKRGGGKGLATKKLIFRSSKKNPPKNVAIKLEGRWGGIILLQNLHPDSQYFREAAKKVH